MSDPLAALEELVADESRHLRRWIDGSHLVDLADLRAAIAKTREAWEVEVREEWGVQKRTYPLGTGYRIYGDDEVGARDAAPKVIGSGAYVIHRTVTTTKRVTPWTPMEAA